MAITGADDIRLHYATTLNHWRRNFFDKISQVRAPGYSGKFIRMWEYYLCYCVRGFLERPISTVHLTAERPAS